MVDLKLEDFENYKIASDDMNKIMGGTSCIVSGTREFNGQTWMDIDRYSSSGEYLSTDCDQSDSDWGGLQPIGTQIC